MRTIIFKSIYLESAVNKDYSLLPTMKRKYLTNFLLINFCAIKSRLK